MRRFFPKLPSVWPIALLVFVEGLLIGANYTAGTFLMGWDNVMPEFSFLQAIRTNIFGVWIEHRGAGLPDGMGHAANLVHTLTLWIMSLALPANTLRYAFHFGMHLTGMIGMYILLRTYLKASGKIMPFIGAFLYGINLITIQMFYTPLEAFSVHYAALPWLTYGILTYLSTGSRKSLLLFAAISLLATPQFFIPTLLLPVALLLGAISLFHLKYWKRILIAAGTVLAVNAFWLLPYIFNLPTNAPIIQAAKINEMSSKEIYARNQAFGDLPNVLSMKGFMLDFEDVSRTGKPIRVMETWRMFAATPLYEAGIILIMAISGIGLLNLGLSKNKTDNFGRGIGLAGLMALLMLANSTPGLSTAMNIIRDHVPLLGEAYRFSFTKFSLLYALSVSVLFVIGLSAVWKTIGKIGKASNVIYPILITFIVFTITHNALPAFQGSFFYDNLKIELPNDYIALFQFMNTKDPAGRTAYFPQTSYWSWKHYSFGYVGSGFVWYGLQQPLMDRAFDPWSNVNENYYWELSYALYSKNPLNVQAVLSKYDIQYIIFDGYALASGNDMALIPEETAAELAAIPSIRKIGSFGRITVYERTDTSARTFIRTSGMLKSVNAYGWTDYDAAYRDMGDYESPDHTQDTHMAGVTVYPFRSLFTKRSIDERDFTVTATSSAITIASSYPDATGSAVIHKTDNVFSTDYNQVLIPQALNQCGVLKSGPVSAESISTPYGNGLRMTSSNQRGCLSFGTNNLLTSQAYLVSVAWHRVTGRPILFSLINDTAKHVEAEALLETDSPSKNDWHISYFVLPPLAPDGLGYSIYIMNDSIGQTETVNDIGSINFYTFPYQEMVSAHSQLSDMPVASDSAAIQPVMVTHPNPGYYTATVPVRNKATTLILSQSYNTNWYAYDVSGLPGILRVLPFAFEKPIARHTMVNNWENGWVLPEQTTDVVILFLPQYLEYAGFAVLVILFGALLIGRSR